MTPHEHKRLLGERNALRTRVATLGTQIVNLEADLRACEKRLVKVEKEIAEAGELELVVSEHAIIRYLQRVDGIDVARVATQISNDVKRLGITTDGKHACGQYWVNIQNGVVVTVV